ncbi:DUF736 domain-containing protein [Parasphingorhabdus sp.]|uniref:DUF736 domain-containing protein n=1 Tax=Parasphingorhabdus sp. TaxID=2709688 RepID=UPI003D2A8ADA
MTKIGIFAQHAEGFSGHIRTLTLNAEVCLVEAEQSDNENAPDFRLHLGNDGLGMEIGAGWKHIGEKAGDYVAILIDDPTFGGPIRANLFQSDRSKSSHVLMWSRSTKREERT